VTTRTIVARSDEKETSRAGNGSAGVANTRPASKRQWGCAGFSEPGSTAGHSTWVGAT